MPLVNRPWVIHEPVWRTPDRSGSLRPPGVVDRDDERTRQNNEGWPVPSSHSEKGASVSREGLESLQVCWSDWRNVVTHLAEDDWSKPSACPGWTVKDLVAHIGSNLKEVVEPSRSDDPATPPAHLPAEAAMDHLVDQRSEWSVDAVLAELVDYEEVFFRAVEVMQDEPLASRRLQMRDLGHYEFHQFAEAFAFDLYCHLRNDLLAPRGPIEQRVPPPDEVRLRGVLGWMFAGLPQMNAERLSFVDRAVQLELTEPGGGTWTVQPRPDDQLLSVAQGSADRAVVRITSPSDAFVRWATGREDWRSSCQLVGDREFAIRFLNALQII